MENFETIGDIIYLQLSFFPCFFLPKIKRHLISSVVSSMYELAHESPNQLNK